MKRLLLSIGSILLFSSVHGQQVLNLLTGEVREGYDVAEPVETVESLEDGFLVTWDFTEVYLIKDDDFPNSVLWRVAGFMNTFEAGTPAFQYLIDWQKVENQSPSSMKIVESNYVDFNYQLAPAIPLQPIGPHPYDEVERTPISPYEGFMPDSIVKDLGYKNSDSYLGYYISPFQYNYEQQIVRAYTKIVYKVTLSDSTTGIKELKTKEDMPTNSFTLDGRPVKGNAKSVIVQDGKKRIVR